MSYGILPHRWWKYWKMVGLIMETKYKPTYYACFQMKDGYIKKIKFNDREEAHRYVNEHFDPAVHSQCWTE